MNLDLSERNAYWRALREIEFAYLDVTARSATFLMDGVREAVDRVFRKVRGWNGQAGKDYQPQAEEVRLLAAVRAGHFIVRYGNVDAGCAISERCDTDFREGWWGSEGWFIERRKCDNGKLSWLNEVEPLEYCAVSTECRVSEDYAEPGQRCEPGEWVGGDA